MEYGEDTVVFAHRVFSAFCYISLTFYYCIDEHGLCRPMPFKFYLQGMSQDAKFKRDPVSLVIVLLTFCLIVAMQIYIELKKQDFDKSMKNALKMADQAYRSIHLARLRLEQVC